MRAMPFRTAAEESVDFRPPTLQFDGSLIAAGEPVAGWDYLSEVTVIGAVMVDHVALLSSTSLERVEDVSVVLQVDCPTTGYREVSLAALTPGSDGQYSLSARIPPDSVADELEVRYGLVLTRTLEDSGNMAPTLKGSRVFSPVRSYRFYLEGSGAGFPTEAFDFEKAGMPAGAPWHLSFQPESLDEPFMAAVRLYINAGHPAAEHLLAAKPGVHQGVLFHGILEQLLLGVADSDEELRDDYEEGSVGATLSDLAMSFLDRSLKGLRSAMRNDRDETLTKLRARTTLLRDEK